MAGILDFLNTPAGQGLLSGVASYAMNARRGTPINNIGRGLAGGVMGYQGALQDIDARNQQELNNKYRQAQMDNMTFQIESEKAKRERHEAAMKAIQAGLKPGTQAEAPYQMFDGEMAPVTPATTPTFFGKPIDPFTASMIPLMDSPDQVYSVLNKGEGKTAEIKNYEYAQTLPQNERNLFMQTGRDSGMPASVKEWEYYEKLSPEKQAEFRNLKRTQQYVDFGGYKAPVLSSGGLGTPVPVTMTPAQAVQAGQEQRKLDYTTPKPTKPQNYTVTTPDGQVFQFKDKKTADQFREETGGR
jgi:hypothetical protein